MKNTTSFKPGRVKTGGRKKGTPNKKSIVKNVVKNNVRQINDDRLKIKSTEELIKKINRDLVVYGLRNRSPKVRLFVALEIFKHEIE